MKKLTNVVMNSKLFYDLRITLKDIKKSMVKSLEGNNLIFVLKSTTGRAITLYSLHVKINNGAWINLIKNTISDNDGEIDVYMGSYNENDTLQIHFGVFAIEEISKAACFIVKNYKNVYKLSPKDDDFKQIQKKKTWEDTQTCKVGEGEKWST